MKNSNSDSDIVLDDSNSERSDRVQNEPGSPDSKRRLYTNSLSSNPNWFEENEQINTANANDPNKGMFSIPEINREEVMKEASVGMKIRRMRIRIIYIL
jgi:hypothetical protein